MKLIGHQKQWDFLTSVYRAGRLASAYLFSGPAHVGKKTFATKFSQLILCKNPDLSDARSAKECEACESCEHIRTGSHPDVYVLGPSFHPDSRFNRPVMHLDKIQALRKSFGLTASSGDRKIAILEDVETFTQEAASALLKILEEPPGEAIFFLITPRPAIVLETIRSRAQRVWFPRVPDMDIMRELVERGEDRASAKEIVEDSFGLPGRALQILAQPEYMKREKKQVEAFLHSARSENAVEKFAYFERDFKNISQSDALAMIDLVTEHVRHGDSFGGESAQRLLSQLLFARKLIDETNVAPERILESALLTP